MAPTPVESSICSGRTSTPTAHGSGAGAPSSTAISPSTELDDAVLEPAEQQVPVADEAGDLAVHRPRVEHGGLVALDDRPALQHGDPVGDRERLVLVVGDEDRGRAGLAAAPRRPRGACSSAARRRGTRTARRGGRAPGRPRARVRARLAGAPRPRAGAADRRSNPASPTSSSSSATRRLGRAPTAAAAPAAQAEADVAGDARDAGRARPPAARTRSAAARAGRRRAARRRATRRARSSPASARSKPGDQAQEGRLAAARGAEDRGQRALLDLERDVVEDRRARRRTCAAPSTETEPQADARPCSSSRLRRCARTSGRAGARAAAATSRSARAYGAAAP